MWSFPRSVFGGDLCTPESRFSTANHLQRPIIGFEPSARSSCALGSCSPVETNADALMLPTSCLLTHLTMLASWKPQRVCPSFALKRSCSILTSICGRRHVLTEPPCRYVGRRENGCVSERQDATYRMAIRLHKYSHAHIHHQFALSHINLRSHHSSQGLISSPAVLLDIIKV